MSLADACLVRLAELYEDSKIMTLDRDFNVYRKKKIQSYLVLHLSIIKTLRSERLRAITSVNPSYKKTDCS